MVNDITEVVSLSEANMCNIPMNCCYFSPEELGGEKWLFIADNYTPRGGSAGKEFYKVEADTEDELVEYVKACILPIYQELIEKLGDIR